MIFDEAIDMTAPFARLFESRDTVRRSGVRPGVKLSSAPICPIESKDRRTSTGVAGALHNPRRDRISRRFAGQRLGLSSGTVVCRNRMTDSDTTATDLATRIFQGDPSAEIELVRQYSRGVLIVLRQRCQDPLLVEDLSQDALRIVIERLRNKPLDDPSRLNAFICATARNLLIGDVRKKARRKTVTDSDIVSTAADTSHDPFREVGQIQTAKIVHQLIDEMGSERDRILLDRFYIKEQDKEEICADLDLTSIHFNRVLFRARRRFKELLMRFDESFKETGMG